MEISITSDKDPFTIILLSDTHIIKRNTGIDHMIFNRIHDSKPDLILHCGDVSTMDLLDDLKKIAPVYAVRGNRDFLIWNRLPPFVDLNINGCLVHIEHRQGDPLKYLRSKTYFFLQKIRRKPFDPHRVVSIRYNYDRYDLYCFGHSHYQQVDRIGKTVFVNPGHIDMGTNFDPENPPSFALIRISQDNIFVGVTVCLHGNFSEIDYNYNRK